MSDTTPRPESDVSNTDIETRSEIARFLGKEAWPADRDRLLQVAGDNDATDRVLGLLSGLPAGREYQNVQEVSVELGIAESAPEG